MQHSRKRRPGRILVLAYPVAKYLAFLLIPLSLYRLPPQTWLLPDITGSRAWFMLWPALLMLLGLLADRRARRALELDAREKESKTASQGSHFFTFLALCDLGLLILDAAAIAHLYLSWYRSAAGLPDQPLRPLLLILMAMGCVGGPAPEGSLPAPSRRRPVPGGGNPPALLAGLSRAHVSLYNRILRAGASLKGGPGARLSRTKTPRLRPVFCFHPPVWRAPRNPRKVQKYTRKFALTGSPL